MLNVSVPEKTLEHWATLCITYRYWSYAAQWWPASGVDIDVQALPDLPGKAIQLELKTITQAGPGRHKVNIDLRQLRKYARKPLVRQPFYAFPWPHWDGELFDAARDDGQEPTELAFQRSNGWWFGNWMVVMTTRQVAGVLRKDLDDYDPGGQASAVKCLVQFDIHDPGKPVWGDPASSVPPSEVLGWSQFWSELDECGRADWPQLIQVPVTVLDRWRNSRRQDTAEELYSRYELAEMFRYSEGLLDELQGRTVEYEVLEPDGAGGFRVGPDPFDTVAGAEPSADTPAGEPEDRRRGVFISSRKLFRAGS